METREVTFTDEDETRQVEITHWRPGPRSREISSSQQRREVSREPDWSRILPGYIVEGRIGGYFARRR